MCTFNFRRGGKQPDKCEIGGMLLEDVGYITNFDFTLTNASLLKAGRKWRNQTIQRKGVLNL